MCGAVTERELPLAFLDCAAAQTAPSAGLSFDEYIRTKVSTGSNGDLCLLCGKMVKHRCNVKRHFNDCHSRSGVVYQCPACNSTYKSKSSMSGHIFNKHKEWQGVSIDSFAVPVSHAAAVVSPVKPE